MDTAYVNIWQAAGMATCLKACCWVCERKKKDLITVWRDKVYDLCRKPGDNISPEKLNSSDKDAQWSDIII